MGHLEVRKVVPMVGHLEVRKVVPMVGHLEALKVVHSVVLMVGHLEAPKVVHLVVLKGDLKVVRLEGLMEFQIHSPRLIVLLLQDVRYFRLSLLPRTGSPFGLNLRMLHQTCHLLQRFVRLLLFFLLRFYCRPCSPAM